MKNYPVLFLAMMVVLFACTTVRPLNNFDVVKPINEDDINSLHQGVTTKDMTAQVFGQPYNRIRTEQGETYIYKYFGDSLAVTFNNSNLLNTFNFTPEAFQLEREDTRRTFRNFNSGFLRKLEPGVATYADFEKEFGAPTKIENGTYRQRILYKSKNDEDLTVYINKADTKYITHTLQ